VRADPKSAILLGGDRIGVSVARSLSAHGVSVHALGHRHAPPRYSRYCASFVGLGGGTEESAERWLDWLVHDGPREGVILPCTDEGLELIARHRDRLVELGYHPAEADDETVLTMLNKERTYALARELGVPAPLSFGVRTMLDVERAALEMHYPCLLKPVYSHHFARHYGGWRKVLVARNREDFVSHGADALSLGLEMLAMEIVPGGDEAIFTYWTYLDADGQPICHFTKRRIRQYPAHFGVGSHHVTEWDPEVAEAGLRFLQGAGARGLAAVEVKRDPRDGKLKLIECNHRLTGSIELGRAAGVDFPLIAYRGALGLPQSDLNGFRDGVRLWMPGIDLRAFLDYRRKGELTTRKWLRGIMRRQRFPVFRWSDPLPAVIPTAFRVHGAVARRLRQRFPTPPPPQPALDSISRISPRAESSPRSKDSGEAARALVPLG
jgi:D-aspartate ligase